jgi:SAM-dependent methyltransferase
MKDKLALGCGDNYHGEDYVHVDLSDLEHVDVQLDLDEGSLPFEDNRFVRVEAIHILEHLTQEALIDILEEIHRVSQPGAEVEIVLPHFLSWNAADLDHYRAGSRKTFVQFCTGYGMNTPYPDLFRERKISYKLNRAKIYLPFRLLLPDRIAAQLVPNIVDEIKYEFEVISLGSE